MNVTKILVPVDFSDNSRLVLKSAVQLAERLDASVAAVFVLQSFEDYSGFFVPHLPLTQFEEELLKNAERRMEDFVDDFETASAVVLAGDVAEEIVKHAAEKGFDLIVMGTHGYKGLERILFGSVAEKVVKSAPCPVLTINPYKEGLAQSA